MQKESVAAEGQSSEQTARAVASDCASFLAAMNATISHVAALEADLAREKFWASQLETVIKIMARRNEGKLLWSTRELDAAVEDERCIMIGALDLDLYGENAHVDAQIPAPSKPESITD